MNCRTCQFELSQSLDGRLASGRRTVVMQHTAECASCASFWDELQRAQALVLQLPRFSVGGDFRERLFERIESGEGTPDAVFRETVSLATKVRYVLTGAAAAAAVLVGITLLRDRSEFETSAPSAARGGPPDPAASPVASSRAIGVASGNKVADANTTNQAERSVPRQLGGGLIAHTPNFDPDSAALFASVAPMTLDLVAREAADHFQQNLQTANFYAARGIRAPQAPEASALWSNAEEMQRLGQLLLDLQDHEHVEFSIGIDRALRYAVDELRAAFAEGDRSDIDRVAKVVASVRNLDALPNEMRIVQRGNFTEREGNELLLRLFQNRGDALHQLFLFLPNDTDVKWTLMDPAQRHGVFAFYDDCGTNWVVPRRLAEQRRLRILMQSDGSQATGGTPGSNRGR
jgi:anti-sigma factor RsiW